MAILTIPAITKGTAAELTLTRADLLALPAVSGDAYYSQAANIRKVAIHFKSNERNQQKSVVFDGSLASATANIFFSTRAVGDFEVQSIVLHDFDGGRLTVKRDSITTPAALDIAL